MRFSLKTMLITVCVAGATIGVMGKLLMEQPETFLQVLRVGTWLVPFLLAIGTIIWIGFRGKPDSPAPTCARCAHDLGSTVTTGPCPVCGADLSLPSSVLSRPTRRIAWHLVAWGVALLLLPVAAESLFSRIFPAGNPLRLLSNSRLIQNRLPNQVDQPWVWNELVYRANKGQLSQQEVDEAVDELIAHMKSTMPNGWRRSLAWQNSFVMTVSQANLISEEVLLDLCDAFYGPAPIIQPLPPISAQKGSIDLKIQYGNPFAIGSGFEIQLLWNVRQVAIHGIPQKINDLGKVNDFWRGEVQCELEPGEHEVTVDVDCAYVDRSKLINPNPPANQWPKARKRWTKTIAVPLKVEPAGLK